MDAVDELNFLLGIGPPRPNLPLTIRKSSYTSVRDLGKGTYGQAILVFHKIRNQYYVIKHINMSKMNSKQRKDAHKEISILQQLDHPNIVRYVEYFEEFPHLYIVMEYADGGDLGTHLTRIKNNAKHHILSDPEKDKNSLHQRNGLLTEPQVMSLFVQATIALKHMHDRRLLHRDIKSQNIFLTRNHVVKLGDFGISTVLKDTVAMASTMCGTPCYFSPEICLGKPYNNKSDVWALGVLLYEMCANRLPFESSTMKALMNEILNNEPRRIPANFSEELWELIQWMLNKDPKKRPDAQQVLMSSIVMRHMPNIIAKLKSIEDTERNCDPEAGEKIAKQPLQQDKVIDNNARFPIIENNPIDLGGDKVSGINPVGKKAEALPLNNRNQQKPAKLQPTGMKEPKIVDDLKRNPNTERGKNIPDYQAPQNMYDVTSLLHQQHNDAKEKSERGRGRPYQRISQEFPAQTSEATLQGRELEGREANMAMNLNDLSPGQRAAQEIQMMQRQKPSESERMALRQCPPGKADKPVEFPREMHPRPLQGGLNGQLSISALIETYDLEKKKVTNLRQKEHFLNPRQAPVAPLNQYLVNNAHQQMMRGHRALDGDFGSRGPLRQVSAAPRLPPMGEPATSILPTKDPNGRPQPQTGCGRGNSHPKDNPSGNSAPRFLTPQYNPSKLDALYRAPILPPLPALNDVGTGEVKGDQDIDSAQLQPSLQEEENNVRSELNDVVHEMTWLLCRFTMSMRGADDKSGGDGAEMAAGLDPQKAAEVEPDIKNIDNSAMAVLNSVQDPSTNGCDGGKLLSSCTVSRLSNREQLEAQIPSEEFLDPLGTRLDVEKLQAQTQQGDLPTEISEKESQKSSNKNSTPTSPSPECNDASSEGSTQIMLDSSFRDKSASVTAAANRVRCDSCPTESDAESRQPNACLNRNIRGSNAQLKTSTPAAETDPTQNSCNMRLNSLPLGKDSIQIQTSSKVQVPSKVFTSDDLSALQRNFAMKCFNGTCLCGGTRVQGIFSNIYGSFVCKCNACCRVSGSCHGVEWLHLPQINHIENILNLTSPTDGAAIRNEEESNGARILMNNPTFAVAGGNNEKKGSINHRPEIFTTPSEYHFTILVDVSDDDNCGDVGISDVSKTHVPISKIDQQRSGVDEGRDHRPCDATDLSHSPVRCSHEQRPCQKVEGFFRVHFCPTCGCVLGMEHDGIDGLLLSKLLLTPTSTGVLLQFEQIIDELNSRA